MKILPNLKVLPDQIESIDRANHLVQEHLHLPRAIVFTRFVQFNFMADDLISVGYLGLIRASRTWEDRGVQKFSSHAYTVIVSHIWKWLRAERVRWRSLASGRTDYTIALEKYKYWDCFTEQSITEISLDEYNRHLTRAALDRLFELSKLSPSEKVALEMRLNGEDDKAIAAKLNTNHPRSTVLKGMRKLRAVALQVNLAATLAA